MKKIIKRYRAFIITAAASGVFALINHQIGLKALSISAYQFQQMLFVIPPVFVLLGLLDVWVPREKMIRYMGDKSGWKGTLIAFLLGSFAAGPLLGAFPFAAVLMKKGASFMNIMIFIGAWSTTKIPMLLFEISALGARFAFSRLAIDIVGIVAIAFAIRKALPKKEIERLYAEAEKLS